MAEGQYFESLRTTGKANEWIGKSTNFNTEAHLHSAQNQTKKLIQRVLGVDPSKVRFSILEETDVAWIMQTSIW